MVTDFVTPVQERTQELLDDPAQLDQLLAVGAEKARAVAGADAGRRSTTGSGSSRPGPRS